MGAGPAPGSAGSSVCLLRAGKHFSRDDAPGKGQGRSPPPAVRAAPLGDSAAEASDPPARGPASPGAVSLAFYRMQRLGTCARSLRLAPQWLGV